MNKNILGLVLASSTLVMSASVHADFISDSFSIAHQTTELTTATATGLLNQFDTNLGTLNSISLDLSGESISSTVLENTAAQSQTFKFDSTLDWLFEVLAGSGNNVFGFTTNLASTGGFVTLASGGFLDLGTTADNGTFNLVFTGAGLTPFLGTGQVGIGCNTFTTTTFGGGGGNISNAQNTTGACSANITYDYTAVTPPGNVPEPTSLALLGMGIAAFGFARRKKSA